ncbi:hypothetical protein IMAU80009_03121 [Lactiplantibacillus plantarum]|nr:hypothetical protein [Lactiplantibacillus plantarum]
MESEALVTPLAKLSIASFIAFGADLTSKALAKALVIVLIPFSAATPTLLNSLSVRLSDTHFETAP